MRLSQWLILLNSLAWPKDIPYTCIWRTDRDKPLLTSSWMLHGSWQSLISPRAIHRTDSPILGVGLQNRVPRAFKRPQNGTIPWSKSDPSLSHCRLASGVCIGATSSSKDRDSSLESLEHYFKAEYEDETGLKVEVK